MTSSPALRNFARYAASVLAYNVVVVLWGAFVRATGSGAGCGNHWPLCNGVAVPQAPALTTIIEFTHRAMSGIDVVLVGILLVWAWRVFPRGHLVRLGGVLSAIFLTTEALIGAALVKLEHVAHNASAGRAYSLSAHLINTLTLLACLTLTLWWAAGGGSLRLRQRATWLAAPGIVLAVLVGISGAIAALGDTLFPASSLAAGFRQDFDPASSIFLRLRLLHPLLALITGGWLIFYAEVTAFRLPSSKKYARKIESIVGLQILAGASNLLLLAPVWMQMVHLLLADLVWISLVLLVAVALQDSSLPADMHIDEMVPRVGGLERAGAKRS
ncbi:MAG TPA: COX15/CtaA family protein [Bryobacteraceae bacterium]|nr:COX15/CtaA family protein [Bryobacteraceae bacterium]